MGSNEKLAAALTEVGLTEMAERAAKGWYNDYFSPLDTPAITLADDLAVAAATARMHRAGILKVRARHLNGEFDATTEESEAWAKSPEGQETFRKLHK